MGRERILERLQALGVYPREENVPLYELAFTHSSVNGNAGTRHKDYERLEFLGDALMGFLVGELCYELHPELQQGGLTALRAHFIRTEGEASLARKLGFGPLVLVGSSFQGDPEKNDSLMEDVLESFLGALLLDQGLPFARSFVRNILEEEVASTVLPSMENPKSELQEVIQADHRESVTYRLISEKGPAHEKTFVVGVYFEDQELARGTGRSKKEAETMAARLALEKLADREEEGA